TMTRTLLRGGHILPVLSQGTPVTAMLVEDERVVWSGDDPGITGADEVIELNGALVNPAFVDAHTHTTETGLANTGVDLTGTHSLADALDLVAAAGTAGAGRPI